MNLSKRFHAAFTIVSLFLVLLLLLMICPYGPTPDGEGMGWMSINRYVPSIESERVTSWYSSLFMYECIGLKHFGSYVLGRDLSALSVLYIVWVGMTMAMLISIICIMRSITKCGWWWLIAGPLCVLLSFKHVGDFFPVNLDYNFMCLMWCLVAAMIVGLQSRSLLSQSGNIVLILFLLMHLIAYRRNFVLTVPFVTVCLFCTMRWFKQLRLCRKLVIWCIGTAGFTFFSLIWVDAVFPVEKRHPLIPMLESDMRIASILRGEENPIVKNGIRAVKGDSAESCISAYWYSIPEERWNEFRSLYVKEWKEHPETMFAACIIQRIQFYSGGHSFPFLKDAVEARFPAVRRNENAWNTIAPTVQSPLKRLFWLCMAPICVVLGFVCRRREIVTPEICAAVIIAGSLSTLYSLSYLVVTPTPDARYLAPSYMFALFSASAIVFAMLELLCKGAFARLREKS